MAVRTVKTATYKVTTKAGAERRVDVFTTYETGKMLSDPNQEIPTGVSYRLDDGRVLTGTLGEDAFFAGGEVFTRVR